jgi:hypothetical protein
MQVACRKNFVELPAAETLFPKEARFLKEAQGLVGGLLQSFSGAQACLTA